MQAYTTALQKQDRDPKKAAANWLGVKIAEAEMLEENSFGESIQIPMMAGGLMAVSKWLA